MDQNEPCKWNQDGKHRAFALPGPWNNLEKKVICQDCNRIVELVKKAPVARENGTYIEPKPRTPLTAEERRMVDMIRVLTLNDFARKFMDDRDRYGTVTEAQRGLMHRIFKDYNVCSDGKPQNRQLTSEEQLDVF